VDLLPAALDYAERGWFVFPLWGIGPGGICECGRNCGRDAGKHPITRNGLLDATLDEGQIRRWWSEFPNANIGVRTGPESGLWVLDLDAKGSVELGGGVLVPQGEASLRDLEAVNGVLPDTLAARTGSGGIHLFFRYPSGGTRLGNRTGFRKAVDSRGEGGYVVAAPSQHLSGNRYRWEDPDNPLALPPDWLVELARSPLETPLPSTGEKIPEGSRNDALFRIGCDLARRYRPETEQDLFYLLAGRNHYDCVPPLTHDEVRRIAGNAWSQTRGEPGLTDDLEVVEIPEGAHLCKSLRELMENPPTEPDYLVEGLWGIGDRVILCGPPNVGKSWLMHALALAVASGTSWLGKEVRQGTVVIVDEESSEWGLYDRFRLLAAGADTDAGQLPVYLASNKGLRFDTPEGDATIRRMLEEYRPSLLVVDSLVRVHRSKENDSGEMSEFLERIKQLALHYSCSVVFIHHLKKPSLVETDLINQMRGSSDIGAWADVILAALPGEESTLIELHNPKQRYRRKSEDAELVQLLVDPESATAQLGVVGTVSKSQSKRGTIYQEILDLMTKYGEPILPEDLAEDLDRAPRTVAEHLKTLVKQGKAVSIQQKPMGGGRAVIHYALAA
jgi:hypothetical protein